MTIDYSAKTIASYSLCEVSDGAGGWVELQTYSCQVRGSAEVPYASWNGYPNANLVEGRAFRVRIVSGAMGEAGPFSGQWDPVIYSGSGVYCGQPQRRLIVDTDNGDVTWFYGILSKPQLVESGTVVSRVSVTATSYIDYLRRVKITSVDGYHYGDTAVLSAQSGVSRYRLADISSDLLDIYAVWIGADATTLTRAEEFNMWTYDHSSQTLIFYSPLPDGVYVVVYGHVAVEPSVVFADLCTIAGIPGAFQDSTALSGYTLKRAFWPQGWTLLEIANNLADMIGYRLYTSREGIVNFQPRPLQSDSTTVVWKDGQESDYQLIAAIDRQKLEATFSKLRVEGSTWVSSQYETKKALIADHSDGSNVNLWGGLIEAYRLSLSSTIDPAAGTFEPSWEYSNRVAKLTGTNVAGACGVRWWLDPDKDSVDISGYDSLVFVGRGNGAMVNLIVGGDGVASRYPLTLPNYRTEYSISLTDFVGNVDLTEATYIAVEQISLGRIDFSIDNIGFSPESATDVTRSQREIVIAAEVGTDEGDSKTLRYPALAVYAEALSMATNRLAREQSDRYTHTVRLPFAQDPATDCNVLAAVTTGAYSYTAEKMEIVGLDISFEPRQGPIFTAECMTPLTASYKSDQVVSGSAVFAAVSMDYDSADQTSDVTFNGTVDSNSGSSPWNAQYLSTNGITGVSGSASAGLDIFTATFDSNVSSTGKNVSNAEIQNITAGHPRSLTVTTAQAIVEFGSEVGPTAANSAKFVGLVPGVVSMAADSTTQEIEVEFSAPVAYPETVQFLLVNQSTSWEDTI